MSLPPFSPLPQWMTVAAFESWFAKNPPHAIRQAEDLCLVLADRRYHPALPKLFAGIAGKYPVDFIASWGIPRGELPAIRRMALPLVRNEFDLFPGRNVFGIVPRLFETAETLCERGIEITDADGRTVRLGGFLPTETERKACLGALLAAGNPRIVPAAFTPETFSFHIAPSGDPATPSRPHRGTELFHALAEGNSVADAIVGAGLVSAGLQSLCRDAAAVGRRLSDKKKPAERRPKPVSRRYFPRSTGGQVLR